ncbi:MAG: cupredoxin domain-containing protein [Chloroflexota bacterium]
MESLTPLTSVKPEFQPFKRWQGFVVALVVALLIVFLPFPFLSPAPSARIFRIEASNFEFSPSEIYVNPGDRVTLELISTDVVHGLSLDNYGISLSAEPGQPAKVTFVANQPGIFRFRCSVTCGNLHPFILGKFQVGQNTLLWRAIAGSILIIGFGFWSFRK